MRECITVQVGQCGNQVGTSFWDLLVREHAARAEDGLFDESMSMFFRNVDIRPTGHCDIVGMLRLGPELARLSGSLLQGTARSAS